MLLRGRDSCSSVGKVGAEQTEMNYYPNSTVLYCPDRMDVALNQINVRKMIYLTLRKHSVVFTTTKMFLTVKHNKVLISQI